MFSHYNYLWRVMKLSVIVILVFIFQLSSSTATNHFNESSCPKTCGRVPIPYPFGIGGNCSLSKIFSLECNNTYNPPRLFAGVIELTNVNLNPPQVHAMMVLSYQCYNKDGPIKNEGLRAIDLNESPYRLSYTKNVFKAVGCDTLALMEWYKGRNYTGGCISMCHDIGSLIDGSCSGFGCCQTSIPQGVRGYRINFKNTNNNQILDFNPCSYGFIVKRNNYTFRKSDLRKMDDSMKFPVILDWAIGNQTCREAKKNQTEYGCVAQYSDCRNSTNGAGYTCHCSKGFRGNPYIQEGCKDIDECKKGVACKGVCVNTIGSYTCTCPPGTIGNATGDGCFEKSNVNGAKLVIVALCGGLFFVLVIVGAAFIFTRVKQHRKVTLRKRYFLENHGLLLQHMLSSCDDSTTNTKIFTMSELIKATNNFDDARIVGCGGHGIVYKGILSDLRVVAIKKSKVVVKSEIEEFINEVALLSQMNHRNIVKLFGCCLESEVPLLVYEFISNGTLADRLHVWDREFNLSWEERLRIASEVAGAVAYLHFCTSKSIFHRDLKSANILLDDRLTVKVSDFGASKFVMADQSHVTTVVQGTFGYLDPEYFHTGRLTDKSDVYSFGVILVELLTGEKPNSISGSHEGRNVITHFLWVLNEKKLLQAIEPLLVDEATREELEVVSELAESCLRLRGEDRPTMKDVEFTLSGLRKTKKKKDGDDENVEE